MTETAPSFSVSLCTTCFNRLHQLRRTLERNAHAISRHPDVEWCIADLGSTDGLQDFMQQKLPEISERVTYLKEASGRPWHSAVAKNIAHRQGRGRILMNLDCDNFIADAVDVVRRYFSEGCEVLHTWSGEIGDGTCGRIAITREAFYRLGGYDESFYPMAYQDIDLLRRAMAAGCVMERHTCDPSVAIKNSKKESIRYCAQDGLTWHDYNRLNRAKSVANLEAGRLVANQPHGWAPMSIERVEIPRRVSVSVSREVPINEVEAPRVGSSHASGVPRKASLFSRVVRFLGSPLLSDGVQNQDRRASTKKKTVLMAWELGRGLGHINRLLPVAKRLIAEGHHVVCAFRSSTDIDSLAKVIPLTDILQAPHFRRTTEHEPNPTGYVYNYADLLFRCGYASFSDLDGLVRQWHETFATVGPDLIVCDHSPTVILAAGNRVPVLHLGSGFSNPPAGKPLLTLSPKAEAGAAERAAQVMEAMAGVRRKLGAESFSQVSDLFASAESLACCLPLLDPYRTTRREPAIGPVQGLPSPLPPGERSFVFGYLAADDVRMEPLLGRLIKASIPTCMYIRQAPPAWFELTEGTSVKLFDTPQKLPDALVVASAVLHHGGLSTTEMALAAGRPQFLLPRYLEQQLTADAVERLSCGVNLGRRGVDPIAEIQKALKRPILTKSAEAVAAKIAAEPRKPAGEIIMERCRYHLTS